MKPGDEVVGGGWVAVVVQVLTRQAVYVSPPGEWRWDRDVELTGVSIPAVARQLKPKGRGALVEFLLLSGYGTNETVRCSGSDKGTVVAAKRRLGLPCQGDAPTKDWKPWKKTPPEERPLWWHIDQEKRRKKREERKREQGNKE